MSTQRRSSRLSTLPTDALVIPPSNDPTPNQDTMVGRTLGTLVLYLWTPDYKGKEIANIADHSNIPPFVFFDPCAVSHSDPTNAAVPHDLAHDQIL